jgi:tetratricopeptide (TPR) repeat protein
MRGEYKPHENDFGQINEYTASVVNSLTLSVTPSDHIMRAQCALACCTNENRHETNELAEQHIRLAVAADPSSVEYNTNLGSILEKRGKDDEATDVFNTVLKLRPNYAFAQEMSKHLLLRRSDVHSSSDDQVLRTALLMLCF